MSPHINGIRILSKCENIFKGQLCTIQASCRIYSKGKDLHYFIQVLAAVSDLTWYKIEYIIIV